MILTKYKLRFLRLNQLPYISIDKSENASFWDWVKTEKLLLNSLTFEKLSKMILTKYKLRFPQINFSTDLHKNIKIIKYLEEIRRVRYIKWMILTHQQFYKEILDNDLDWYFVWHLLLLLIDFFDFIYFFITF